MRVLSYLASLAICLGVSATSFGQGEVQASPESTVSIASRGTDVRSVLHDLFTQTKKNYVLESEVRHTLYLALSGVDFDEALLIVCKAANLSYTVQNGIYYLAKAKADEKSGSMPSKPTVVKPKGKLPDTVLLRSITTRLPKTDLREVFAELGRQTGIIIEVEASVPLYKLDVFLNKTSLRYGLDVICRATGLKYQFTENQTLMVSKGADDNRIALVKGDEKQN